MVQSATATTGVGFSDSVLLLASIAGFCMLAVTVYSIIITRLKSVDELLADDNNLTEDERLARADVATLNRAQRRSRAKAIMKEQRRATVHPAAPHQEGGDGEPQEDGEEHQLVPVDNDDDNDDQLPVVVLSRKERQMAAKAAEREERHLFQAEREQQQKEAQLVAQSKKKERLQAEAVRVQQQHAAQQAQERQERSAWSTFLTPATTSDATATATQSVHEFLQDCQNDRVVRIDKIAAAFGVPSQQVIERLEQLLHEGRIAGFFQDEDRFVFVSDDELSAMAAAVSQQGSVSLEDITAICQQVIGLTR